MTHYHLLGGLPGYTPNMNEICDSLEEAKFALEDLVEDEIDQKVANGQSEEQASQDVWWDRSLTYVTIKNGGNECYQIEECEEDCPIDEPM